MDRPWRVVQKFRETRETLESAIALYGVKIGITQPEAKADQNQNKQDLQTEFSMSTKDTNGPFDFNNWLNHDGDGGTATKNDFQIGQNNRIHSPTDGDPNSVTLVGATIVDVRTPQNAALVGKNGCINDTCIGVYGEISEPSPFGGIGVAGACDTGCGVAGIAIAESATVLDLPPNSTGVYGKGDVHGVYGASGTIPAGSTPDLSALGPTQQTVAVVGANNDSVAAHAPAILGINGILAQDLQKPHRRTGKRYNWRAQCSSERANEVIALNSVRRKS